MLPVEVQQPILDRADGNPLFAEEFVRLLKDKDLLARKSQSWELREGAVMPFPDSVKALIAARLDTLSADVKSLLADAAVIGKVFWAGAIAHMGRRDITEVTEALRDLSRKELVRQVRRSSIEGEAEYAFWHILVRDVAYGQLPRPSRASRHIAAARWIESKAPERVEDVADILAYHYSRALNLTRAAGDLDGVVDLEASALRFLSLAGERALDLDAVSAFSNLERALALAPVGHPDHAECLVRFAEAALGTGRAPQAADALEEAIESFRASGDLTATSRAMRSLSEAYFRLGDARAWALPREALELLMPVAPSPDLVDALTEVAHSAAIRGRSREGIDFADQAIDLADELGLPRPARALGVRGYARADLGDPAGLEDFREAIALAAAAGQGRDGALLLGNMGYKLWLMEGPAASLEVLRENIAFEKARGLTEGAESTRAFTLDLLFDLGEIDDVVAGVAAFGLEASREAFASLVVRSVQARVASLRGGDDEVDLLDRLEQAARGTEDPDSVVGGLGASALARAELGQERAAAALLTELEAYPGARQTENYPVLLAAMVRAAVRIGDRHLAERLLAELEPRTLYAKHALLAAEATPAEAHGDFQAAAEAYADAADRWALFGVVPEHAFALLSQGRCLVGLSLATKAVSVLHRAREIFVRLKAVPAIAEADALLRRVTALSS
jgi:tetratricopeptide (TPR) repeat protein